MLKALLLTAVAASFSFAAEPAAGPDPDVALKVLLTGNRRFVAGRATHPHQTLARLRELSKGQHPSAVILSCADSRVAPELLFDQGLGDVFIVRVAGNILDDENLGSIEYAVEHLGTRLIVVLGHQRCGAVSAAVQGGKPAGHVGKLVEDIQPSVEATKGKPGDAVENAMRANVLRMVSLIADDETLGPVIKEGKVKVVGARYDLDNGRVELVK
ncbi:MAG: carbonic anhydrase [Acidobacteria bacterium]|nr:carbonic anhydrase [Acidobacteriota bacterium]